MDQNRQDGNAGPVQALHSSVLADPAGAQVLCQCVLIPQLVLVCIIVFFCYKISLSGEAAIACSFFQSWTAAPDEL